MKRVICLILCLFVTASLFVGCKKQNSNVETTLAVGYARADVTPEDSMPLAGYGDNRPSTQVLDPLYITCIAMQDGLGNTFLMYHCDFLGAPAELLFYERKVSNETGVPIANIITCGTHNHSAPAMDASPDQFPLVEDYVKLCRNAMMQTAKEALADLKPAKMYVASIKCEGMCIVRHYQRANGIVDDSSGYSGSNKYVGHPVPADDTMGLIKFTREGGKDVVLMNWQGHPRGQGNFDADYFGQTLEERKSMILSDVDVIRRNMEQAMDCNFAFFLGASGNAGNSSWLQEERITSNYIEHGEKLTQKAVEASANFQEVKVGALRRETVNVSVIKKDGFTEDVIPASVFTIGNAAAFVIVPYEMFSVSALAIKDGSQFGITFVNTVAEGGYGYMPSMETFDPAQYRKEAYEVRVTNYQEGTAETMVEAYLNLLNQMIQ